jgi:integrase
MSLYHQPKSPHWWIRIQVAGTKIRRSTGTTDRREAEEFEQRERARLWRLEKLGDRSATTFAEAAARWLIETTKKTKAKDELLLEWFCSQPELKDAPLSEIDIDAIQALRQLLADEGKSKATVDRYMALLRAILRKCALEWRYIDQAPKVPMHNVRPTEPEWLTRDQFKKLKAELPEHLALAAEFAVLTGLRMRSMLGLTWSRVDLARRLAWVPGAGMKGKKALGSPLSRDAVKVLRKLKTLNPKGEHVFQWDGEPIDDCNTAAFTKARERAGLPNTVNWHTLRHTFASWAFQNGVSLHELMQLGGWKSYAMVLRYGHLAADHLAQAADKVAGKGHTSKRSRA